MITIAENEALLRKFNERYKTNIGEAPQGSAAWLTLKLGVISASNAHKVVSKGETRETYMAELVAQVATGLVEEINSKHLDWGNQNEDAARAMYEFTTKNKVTEVPFIFKDDTFRVGCSPDGFVNGTMGLELKAPSNSANYIKFLTGDKLKSEWDWQTQFCMYVCKSETWDVAQYDPRMLKSALHRINVCADYKRIATIEDAVPQFISDMDKMLVKIGINWGDQWARLATQSTVEVAV